MQMILINYDNHIRFVVISNNAAKMASSLINIMNNYASQNPFIVNNSNTFMNQVRTAMVNEKFTVHLYKE